MASVIPSSSALSDEAAGGGMYLYSFFNTLLVKYGFSLKCYVRSSRGTTVGNNGQPTPPPHSRSTQTKADNGRAYYRGGERAITLTNSSVKHRDSTESRTIHTSSR